MSVIQFVTCVYCTLLSGQGKRRCIAFYGDGVDDLLLWHGFLAEEIGQFLTGEKAEVGSRALHSGWEQGNKFDEISLSSFFLS